MEIKEILHYIDHTQLKAYATWEDIVQLCEEAIRCQTASVCIPPCYVGRVWEKYQNQINICTVIGFPLGYSTPDIKAAEAARAIKDGANEIDMVINLTDVKNQNWDKVQEEVDLLRKVTGSHILKVIIETCYLTTDEKIRMCEIVTNANADYIKTSTGFGTAGAALEDIQLFKEHIGSQVKIKAAGGIRTKEAMESYIQAGCDRIGSSAVKALIEDM